MSAAAGDRAALDAFRPQRTVPAVIVAVLLVALGALVAAEIVSRLLGRPLGWLPTQQMLDWGTSTAWQNPLVLIGAILVTLIGLTIMMAGLLRGRPRMVPLRTGDPQLVIGMRRRSLGDALAYAARQVTGVREASASLRGRTVAVTAVTSGWNDATTGEAVGRAVRERLSTLAPVEHYEVSVRLRER